VAADVLCSEPIMSHDLGDRLLDHHTGSLRREELTADRRHGWWCVRMMFDLTSALSQEQFIHLLGPQGFLKKDEDRCLDIVPLGVRVLLMTHMIKSA
jgi:hypothetical protein